MTSYKLDASGNCGGDRYERLYCDKFIRSDFPQYELYWEKCVVPLTNRPTDINFKSKAELASIPDGEIKRWCAQLHYTVLFHLCRVYDIKQQFRSADLNVHAFIEGILRLASATDVAFELLGRKLNPHLYASVSKSACENARTAGKGEMTTEIESLRKYRNFLVHSSLTARTPTMIPKIGKEQPYLDWASVTDSSSATTLLIDSDFDFPISILIDAWDEVLTFLNSKWKSILLT